MTTDITKQTILALAPDDASRSAAQEISKQKKWSALTFDDNWVCGECSGSSSTPYRTFVHHLQPTYQCSCPSRKSPCKHILGLLLLQNAQPGLFSHGTPPDWALQSLKKAESSGDEKLSTRSRPKQTAGSAAVERREGRMSDGIDELRLWLRDLVRSGLADVKRRGDSYWNTMAARMVDAQIPGAARILREISGIESSSAGRHRQTLYKIAQLHLLTEAYSRREQLDDSAAADLRTAMGWPVDRSEFLSRQDGIIAHWAVAGQRTIEEDGLRSQRTWLISIDQGKRALHLQYAYGQTQFETLLTPATIVTGMLAYYPSSFPVRALFTDGPIVGSVLNQLPFTCVIPQFLSQFSAGTAIQPWLDRMAATLMQVFLLRSGSEWSVRDGRSSLPLHPSFNKVWHLAAVTGGRAADLCGEWDGEYFWPLSVGVDGVVIAL